MKLFMSGKLKIGGNVMASQKLEFLKKLDPKRGGRGHREARGAGGAAAAARRGGGRGDGGGEGGPGAEALRGARRAARREPGPREGGRRGRAVQGHGPGRAGRVDLERRGERQGGATPRPTRRSRSPTRTSRRSQGRDRCATSTSTASSASTATSRVAHRLGFLKGSSEHAQTDEGASTMGRKVNVIGVGMVKFAEARRERGVPRDGGEGRQGRARGREGRLQRGRAGVRRLRVRRLDVRPARGLRARPHRHPGVQRQQQLLDRLAPRSCSARRRSRAGSPSACSPSASSRWRRARSASKWTDRANPLDRFVNVMNEEQGFNHGAARRADVRRRRPRVPLEVRHQARDVRQDQREGAQARVEEPVRAVQRGALGRGDHGLRRGVRSAHALPVLPADVRRGARRSSARTSSRRSTASRSPSTSRPRR